MWILDDPLAVLLSPDSRLGYGAPLRSVFTAHTAATVADDAEHVRPERRVNAVDTNRPDYDAVPEHDPDGTPWAA